METLKITVKDKAHARLLTQLARELNFVTAIEHLSEGAVEVPTGNFASKDEFLSLVGLWKDRDISVEQIRQQAWREVKR